MDGGHTSARQRKWTDIVMLSFWNFISIFLERDSISTSATTAYTTGHKGRPSLKKASSQNPWTQKQEDLFIVWSITIQKIKKIKNQDNKINQYNEHCWHHPTKLWICNAYWKGLTSNINAFCCVRRYAIVGLQKESEKNSKISRL